MGLLRVPNERHVVVNGWEVAAVAPSVAGGGVYLQLNSATSELRQLLRPEHARELRELAALLNQVADEVEGKKASE